MFKPFTNIKMCFGFKRNFEASTTFTHLHKLTRNCSIEAF